MKFPPVTLKSPDKKMLHPSYTVCVLFSGSEKLDACLVQSHLLERFATRNMEGIRVWHNACTAICWELRGAVQQDERLVRLGTKPYTEYTLCCDVVYVGDGHIGGIDSIRSESDPHVSVTEINRHSHQLLQQLILSFIS